MKIPALRIEINGELVAIAGADGLSLLSGQIGLGSGSTKEIDPTNIMLSVMGLAVHGPRPRQLTWCDGVRLSAGDRVTFQVVGVEHPSLPSSVLGSPSTEELAQSADVEKKKPGKRRDA